MIFASLTITACSRTEVKYVDRPYEVRTPVKCVVPDSNCSFSRKTDTEVISSLLECIIEMKHNEQICK